VCLYLAYSRGIFRWTVYRIELTITNICQNMKLKNIFGTILTTLGIAALIYAAFLFANATPGTYDVRSSIIFAVLGLIFFITGIGLIRAIGEKHPDE